jgi:hypothetical protein
MCHRNPNDVKNGLQWKTWIQKSYTHTSVYTYVYTYIHILDYIYITLHYITLHYITYIYMRHRSVVWSLRSPLEGSQDLGLGGLGSSSGQLCCMGLWTEAISAETWHRQGIRWLIWTFWTWHKYRSTSSPLTAYSGSSSQFKASTA